MTGTQGIEAGNAINVGSIVPPATQSDSGPIASPTGNDRPNLIMQALQGLDALIAAQNSWLKSWHLDMLGGLSERDHKAPAPLRPDLIQWMHTLHHSAFTGHPACARAVDQLRSMQSLADDVAEAVMANGSLPTETYGHFMNIVLEFNSAVRELQNDTWKRLAHIDPLTGLGNRQAMWRRLHVECERHARSETPCCLVMIDVDSFKPINDTHGHGAGDIVLTEIAHLLAGSIRPYDSVFRFGGDEFLLCLPNTDTRAAWSIVERLRLKVANHPLTIRPGVTVRATLSVGIAPLTPADGGERSLEYADSALYTAKRNGRNGVYIWSDRDQ